MSERPTVSIGLPVYNGANFLLPALESILAQTFTDFELIISDNASTDETPEICRKIAQLDQRVRYLPLEVNRGANPNYNRVFAHSRGRYFKWAAHDDLLAPTYLERCVELLERNPTMVLAHSDTELIDAGGEPLQRLAFGALDSNGFIEALPEGHEFWDRLADERSWVRFGGVLRNIVFALAIFGVYRRDALERSHLHQPYYGTDKVLLGELALQGPFGFVDERLFLRRCHENTSTRNADQAQKRAWSGGGTFYPIDMSRGYLLAIRGAELSAYERLRCQAELGRKLLEPGKWRLMLLPGPWNLFGWGSR